MKRWTSRFRGDGERLTGLVDLHSHVLPGVDDGARDVADSVEIARSVAADGCALLAATPHVRHDYPTTAETMRELVGVVQAAVDDAGIELDVRPGGEVALDMIDKLGPDDLKAFGLAGNPDYLLVETPYSGWPLGIAQTFFELKLAGITAVLAHPERNPDVQENPDLVRAVVEGGSLVQVTANSLDGRASKRTRSVACELIRRGHVHLVASDAHSAGVRGAGTAAALTSLNDAALAAWLGRDVPRAIADRQSLPPRP